MTLQMHPFILHNSEGKMLTLIKYRNKQAEGFNSGQLQKAHSCL